MRRCSVRERRNREEEEEDIEQSEARDEERGRILKPAANVTTPASPALMQAKAATTSFARLVKRTKQQHRDSDDGTLLL